jgi:hypothetical protein
LGYRFIYGEEEHWEPKRPLERATAGLCPAPPTHASTPIFEPGQATQASRVSPDSVSPVDGSSSSRKSANVDRSHGAIEMKQQSAPPRLLLGGVPTTNAATRPLAQEFGDADRAARMTAAISTLVGASGRAIGLCETALVDHYRCCSPLDGLVTPIFPAAGRPRQGEALKASASRPGVSAF